MTGRVIVHVGEPKTGTTFLQSVAWANRDALDAAGVTLPGLRLSDHFRAAQDLRGVPMHEDDPRVSWDGTWDVLAAQARRTEGTALISHEMLAGVGAAEADRAIASLAPAEVHVVVTVRDYASLLPAEWQETVKHRNTRDWQSWLGQIIDRPNSRDRRTRWFWSVHDTMDVLRRWGHTLPPEHVHVVTMPPSGSRPTLLWERFAGVLGFDPALADASVARPNESLGLAEVEMLRRLNARLSGAIPSWFYAERVKELLAHRVLSARPRSDRLRLPAGRFAWAVERSEARNADLLAAGYDIVGDLAELLPVPPPPGTRAPRPAAADPEQLLSAALDAVAALLADEYAERSGPRSAAVPAQRLAPFASRVQEVAGRHPALHRASLRLIERVARRRGQGGGR